MDYKHDLLNDKWIVECVFPQLRDGFFVEAGATNGVNGSATLYLERELNWNGICIEPIPHQYEKIKEYRSCIAENKALWSSTGEILDFTYYPKRSGHSAVSAENKNQEKLINEDFKIIKIESITLTDVLKKFNAPKIIDYFCLDVEGSEKRVLEKFLKDDIYKIKAMSVEGHNCNDILLNFGYKRVKNPFTVVKFETYWILEGGS